MKDERIESENLKEYCKFLIKALSTYQSSIDNIKAKIVKDCETHTPNMSYACGDIYEGIRQYTINKEFRHYRKVLNQHIDMLVNDFRKE